MGKGVGCRDARQGDAHIARLLHHGMDGHRGQLFGAAGKPRAARHIADTPETAKALCEQLGSRDDVGTVTDDDADRLAAEQVLGLGPAAALSVIATDGGFHEPVPAGVRSVDGSPAPPNAYCMHQMTASETSRT